MIPSWLPNATFKVMRKIYGRSQIGMSAFKGLISVMLSWGQHLSARDIKATPPPSELSCLQGSESLGLWCWSDESYQPRGGDPQGPGEPHWETCSFVSFTGSGLVFTCFPTISRPVGPHQRLEVASRGGIRWTWLPNAASRTPVKSLSLEVMTAPSPYIPSCPLTSLLSLPQVH